MCLSAASLLRKTHTTQTLTLNLKKILPLGIVFAVLLAFMPRDSKFPYEYRKGREWKYETLFAEFDFPIYKSEEQMREERMNNSQNLVTPYYKYSDEVVNKSIKAAEAMNLGRLRGAVISGLRTVFNRGVIADDGKRALVDLDMYEVIYIQRDKRAYKTPVSEVYRQSDARAKFLADLAKVTDANLDSLFKATGLLDLIVPNVIYDQQTTELVQAESNTAISPTSGYVTAGQLVVSSGEIVTAEIEQMLDSYKREYEVNLGYLGPPALMILGSILIALALSVLLYFVIAFTCPAVYTDTRYYYVLMVFTLSVMVSFSLSEAFSNLLVFIPFTLFALMLQAFLSTKETVTLYSISLLPLLIVADNGAVFYCMYLLAGLVHVYVFKYFHKGWKQFLAALIAFAVLVLQYLAFRACDMIAGNVWHDLLGLFIGAMLTVAGYPLVYLFEGIFNLVSNSRLNELADTSNPLVRLLEQKAPGSFQHSLQVMNMGETVARAVGVNPDLVRVGALYHDIGKTENPLCFVENEYLAGVSEDNKYHTGLTPEQSAHDIIKHVSDGLELAHKHRMPKIVCDFIASHHGTTVVGYFYTKFINTGGSPEEVDKFTYPGRKPVTKSEIILMLCDSVEAASRTLKENTEKAYRNLVERIVAGKMEQGQFDDADITISELNAVKNTMVTYLTQLNHERVVYPKNKLNIKK